jgi:hypothetical protein
MSRKVSPCKPADKTGELELDAFIRRFSVRQFTGCFRAFLWLPASAGRLWLSPHMDLAEL